LLLGTRHREKAERTNVSSGDRPTDKGGGGSGRVDNNKKTGRKKRRGALSHGPRKLIKETPKKKKQRRLFGKMGESKKYKIGGGKKNLEKIAYQKSVRGAFWGAAQKEKVDHKNVRHNGKGGD